jgi:hypothetical protein
MSGPGQRKNPDPGGETERPSPYRAGGAWRRDLDDPPGQARLPRGSWRPVPSLLPCGIRKGS